MFTAEEVVITTSSILLFIVSAKVILPGSISLNIINNSITANINFSKYTSKSSVLYSHINPPFRIILILFQIYGNASNLLYIKNKQ